MAGIAVVVAVLAALTLLPAGLAITGPRINSLRVRRRHSGGPPERGRVGRGGRTTIAERPAGRAGLAALAILIPLTIPLLSLNLGQQDVAALSTSTTARRAYDLLERELRGGRQRAAVDRGHARIARAGSTPSGSSARLAGRPARRRSTPAERCRRTSPRPRGSRRSRRSRSTRPGTTAYFNAIATTGPSETATTELVEKLRSSVIPSAEKGTNMSRGRRRQHGRLRRPRDA